MHEVDMTRSLILTLKDWWEENKKQVTNHDANHDSQLQITRVHLIVGKFTCVEPKSLEFAFEAQTQNSFLEGVILQIQETPLIAFCHSCQCEYFPEIGIHYACPTCSAPMEDIRSGRELKIANIEYTYSAHPQLSNQD